MEYYVLNDMELSFKDVLKRCLEAKPLTNQKDLEEWEAKHEERQKNKANTNGEAKNGDSKGNQCCRIIIIIQVKIIFFIPRYSGPSSNF